jgi:hypothetical protein
VVPAGSRDEFLVQSSPANQNIEKEVRSVGHLQFQRWVVGIVGNNHSGEDGVSGLGLPLKEEEESRKLCMRLAILKKNLGF